MDTWNLEDLTQSIAAASRVLTNKKALADQPAWIAENHLESKVQYGQLYVAVPISYHIREVYDPYFYDEDEENEEGEEAYKPLRWKPNKHKALTGTLWVNLGNAKDMRLDSPYAHPHMNNVEYCLEAPRRFHKISTYEKLLEIKAEMEVALGGINIGSLFTPNEDWHPEVLKAIPAPVKKWYLEEGCYRHDDHTSEDVQKLRAKLEELSLADDEKATTWTTHP